MEPIPAVVLHLHIQAAPGRRGDLLAFLRRAKPYYESLGGVRMRVMEGLDAADGGDGGETRDRMIEVFEYDTQAAYEADDRRVSDDPEMKRHLAEWRSLLAGPPRVEVYRAVPIE